MGLPYATGLPRTTQITTDQHGTYTIEYPCEWCIHRGDSSPGAQISLKISACIFLIFISILGVVATDGPAPQSASEVLTFQDMHSAIDSLMESQSGQKRPSHHVSSVDGQFVGISNFTLEERPGLFKRWNAGNAPLGASWTEHSILSQGLVWDPWVPASCIQANAGELPQVAVLSSKVVSVASFPKGFSFSFGRKAARELGVSVSKRIVVFSTEYFTIPANSSGQIWTQQMVVAQSQRSQRCHKYHYGSSGIRCSEYTGIYEGRMPVDECQSYGWSTGWENVSGESCGLNL